MYYNNQARKLLILLKGVMRQPRNLINNFKNFMNFQRILMVNLIFRRKIFPFIYYRKSKIRFHPRHAYNMFALTSWMQSKYCKFFPDTLKKCYNWCRSSDLNIEEGNGGKVTASKFLALGYVSLIVALASS